MTRQAQTTVSRVSSISQAHICLLNQWKMVLPCSGPAVQHTRDCLKFSRDFTDQDLELDTTVL